ncbi:MAG: type IX secretion system PorP/SprF family membrane protein [Luteibaculaceae bacterium]|jgi:type IX secretion system PorP/SprF family membrane protein
MKCSTTAVTNKMKFIIIAFAAFLTLELGAQDPHFSNYRHSPLSLNPALSGMYVGGYRASFNYRNQWNILPDPYVTFSAGIDMPIYVRDTKLTAGLLFLNDKSGSPELNVTKVFANFGYHMEFSVHNVGISFQPGYVMKSIGGDLSLPDQFNNQTGEFDASLATSEPLFNDAISYLDMNAGLVYGLNLPKFKPKFGIGFFHLTSPQENFIKDTDKNQLRMRTAIHANFKTFVTDEIFVDPHFYTTGMSGVNNSIFGSNFGYRFEKGNILENAFFGISSRNGFSENPDAVILSLGVGVAGFDVAIAYDSNVSNLKTGSGKNSSFEFSLLYTAPSSRILKKKIDSERL